MLLGSRLENWQEGLISGKKAVSIQYYVSLSTARAWRLTGET